MKKCFFKIVVLVALILGFVAADEKPVTIFLAGDSTMADKDEIAFPETGWGQVLPSYFTDKVKIENHARNGRSTRTFISEGRWNFLLSRAHAGDFVVIQFGHNDQSQKKVDRYTTPEDFEKNFKKFVTEAREKGVIPILCTPIERRKFDKSGNFVDQHGKYPNIIRKVAKEMNVAFIDMQHLSMDLIIGEGVEGSTKMFLHVKPGECKKHPDGKEDNTHLRPQGAMAIAQLFVDGLRELKITALTDNLCEAKKVKLTYTTQIPELKSLKNNTNNAIDEGEKGQMEEKYK